MKPVCRGKIKHTVIWKACSISVKNNEYLKFQKDIAIINGEFWRNSLRSKCMIQIFENHLLQWGNQLEENQMYSNICAEYHLGKVTFHSDKLLAEKKCLWQIILNKGYN